MVSRREDWKRSNLIIIRLDGAADNRAWQEGYEIPEISALLGIRPLLTGSEGSSLGPRRMHCVARGLRKSSGRAGLDELICYRNSAKLSILVVEKRLGITFEPPLNALLSWPNVLRSNKRRSSYAVLSTNLDLNQASEFTTVKSCTGRTCLATTL